MRAQSLTRILIASAILFVAASAHAEDAGDRLGADGLRADLERIVSAEESGEWFLERAQLEALYPVVLQSVCRATPAARAEVAASLARDVELAGDPKRIYEQSGEKITAAVERSMHLGRMRAALAMALERVAVDCPFWIAPIPGFLGRQTDRNRFTLSLETGGIVQLRQTEGTWTYGAGLAGRLLPGYGFGRVTVLAGFELAGSAMLRPRSEPSQFVVNFFPAIPVVVRVHGTSWQYDFELAGVSLFQADDPRLSYGVRAGAGIGVKGLRRGFVLPWIGAAVAYEHYFESGGRGTAEILRAGFRVGFQVEP